MDNNPQNSQGEAHLQGANSDAAPNPLIQGHGLVGNIRIGGVNFQRRTAEGSRLLRENFNTVFQEIRPLVEQARTVNQNGISLSTLLNRQSRTETPAAPTSPQSQENFVIQDIRPFVEQARAVNQNGISLSSLLNRQSRTEAPAAPSSPQSPESFVINLGETNNSPMTHQISTDGNTHIHIHNHTGENYFGNLGQATARATSANNNNQDGATAAEALRQVPEARALLEILQKYVPFLLILLVKGLYDHRDGILNFMILFIIFGHSNSVVKREAGKQQRRSITTLLIEVFGIVVCILFIGYVFNEDYFYSNLVFIPPYTQPLSVWDLIWTVGITDFILKLITILIKIVIILLPPIIIPYQKKGKLYLLIEASSQLYRSIAPIQPWLYYLLESYQGAEKVSGVFLSAAYMVSKGSDLMIRIRLFKSAIIKAFQNVTLGSSPSKEQLQTAGSQCPICHDVYETPVLLQCKHIFCESCVRTWFDREQTCPLCRAKVVDDPSWRDGSTTYFTQLF